MYLCSDRKDVFEEMRRDFVDGVRRYDGTADEAGRGKPAPRRIQCSTGDEGGAENASEENTDWCREEAPTGGGEGDSTAHDTDNKDGAGAAVVEEVPRAGGEKNSYVEIISADGVMRTTFTPVSRPLFGVGSERDIVCELKHRPVWRCVVHRKKCGSSEKSVGSTTTFMDRMFSNQTAYNQWLYGEVGCARR